MFRSASLVFILTAALAAAATPRRPEGPDVLVVADAMANPTYPLRPSKEHPVYVHLMGGKEFTLGDAYAGEPMPKPEEIRAAVVAALESQGYKIAVLGGPAPSVVIVYTYGSANLSTIELNDTDPTTGETTSSTVAFNRREIAELVGADKAARKMLMTSEADRINDAARTDRLYVMIGALDTAALLQKKRVLAWRTRISIDARRTSLPESLRVMLASAAPYFGTRNDLPVFVEDADRRKAEVTIGTPTVVRDPAPPAAPKP